MNCGQRETVVGRLTIERIEKIPLVGMRLEKCVHTIPQVGFAAAFGLKEHVPLGAGFDVECVEEDRLFGFQPVAHYRAPKSSDRSEPV